MLSIGDYQLHSLKVQDFLFDGGVKPVRNLDQTKPMPKLHLATRLLLIIGNGRRILVDAGIGELCWTGRWAAHATTPYRLKEELGRLGLNPGDITDLVLTHLHSDHVGGAFTCSVDRLVPVFPYARVIVQEENFRTACRPEARERPSFNETIIDEFRQLSMFQTVSGTRELFPGIDVILSNGHTRGQQLVRVSDGRRTLLHGADLIPTTSHYPVTRVSGNDIDARTVIEEKAHLMEEACEKGWILFFGHDPYRHAATVLRRPAGFVPGPAPEF